MREYDGIIPLLCLILDYNNKTLFHSFKLSHIKNKYYENYFFSFIFKIIYFKQNIIQ